jgi:hypothetical protein
VDEPETQPPAPRSRARRALRSALIAGVIGLLVVLGSLVIATQTGNTQWSASNVSWILFGGATGAVFGPLFTLARDDGADAEVYRAEHAIEGRADTSTEGAQAEDLRRRADR